MIFYLNTSLSIGLQKFANMTAAESEKMYGIEGSCLKSTVPQYEFATSPPENIIGFVRHPQ